MVRPARRWALSTVGPGPSEAHLISTRTYKLGGPCHPPRPPDPVSLQWLGGLSPETPPQPCSVHLQGPRRDLPHPRTLLPCSHRGRSGRHGLLWGHSPPCPGLHALLTAVNSGTPSSHPGCSLTSSVVAQRIILQMFQLVKRKHSKQSPGWCEKRGYFPGKITQLISLSAQG